MSAGRGKHIILSLQKRWNRQMLFSCLLLSVAITLFISAVCVFVFKTSLYFIPVILLLSSVLVSVFFVKKADTNDVTRFLNSSFPQLEESAQLMLQPADELNGLQRIQLRKIEGRFDENISLPHSIRKKLAASFMALFVAALSSLLLFIFPISSLNKTAENISGNSVIKPEVKLADIKELSVTITPPAYTKKAARKQDKFNFVAEQKAMISWRITTTKKANQLQLLFNDKPAIELSPVNKDSTEWMGSKQVLQSGFYRLSLDNKMSEPYQIDMIRDEPPRISVQSPKKQSSFIKWGEPQKITINALIQDDYGVDSAFIQATTASGSGEAVKFKELRIPFPGFEQGSQKLSLQRVIDLPSIGLRPGDELYFYIDAGDNNKQKKRSDVFIVRLEDTAQLFSMSGLATGLDVKPDLFRSQRQIIIETEQLLREKDTLAEAVFNKQSSDIGTDQELLRLRYGKYLGEETETEVGGDHHDEKTDAADFGNADKIIDEFSHKHDIAEDANFFDAATKKQLQAMLTEMWKSSLRLKTYKPKEALPFEYNALRLLKDLQQKTRVYVGKTGVKTTSLNLDKRLSGELNKITQPTAKETVQQKDEAIQSLRKAIGILEMISSGETLQPGDKATLDKASTQLSAQAALHPSSFLPAYQALKRVQNGKGKKGDIPIAGNALQKMITTVYALPQQKQSAPDMNLSEQYFRNLTKRND